MTLRVAQVRNGVPFASPSDAFAAATRNVRGGCGTCGARRGHFQRAARVIFAPFDREPAAAARVRGSRRLAQPGRRTCQANDADLQVGACWWLRRVVLLIPANLLMDEV